MHGAGWGVVALRDPSLWAGKLRLTGPMGLPRVTAPTGSLEGLPGTRGPMGHAAMRVRQGPGQHELLETEWGGLGATFSNLWGAVGQTGAEAPCPREGGRGGHQLICAPCPPSAHLTEQQGPRVSAHFCLRCPHPWESPTGGRFPHLHCAFPCSSSHTW